MKQVLKNHVAVVLDVSGSMHSLLPDVVKVFNNQIEILRQSSLNFEQETRVSVYEFADNVDCLISDTDVARPTKLERLTSKGMTALLDGIGHAVDDMKLLPQKYCDHSFIVYVLTDGGENASRKYNSSRFKTMVDSLPENFTIVAFVPDVNGKIALKNFGIPEGNIDKWDATKQGIEEVGRKFEKSMSNFYTARSKGTRSFTTVFSDLNKMTVEDVKTVAKEVKKFEVVVNEKTQAVQIKDLVENKLKTTYRKGCAFYELVKNETVQPSKEVAVQNKQTGKVYVGKDARAILNLPDHETKVDAKSAISQKWVIYIQSNSVNRNVIPKQRVLVI